MSALSSDSRQGDGQPSVRAKKFSDTERLDWLESRAWAGHLSIPGLDEFRQFIQVNVPKIRRNRKKAFIREAIDFALSANAAPVGEETKSGESAKP